MRPSCPPTRSAPPVSGRGHGRHLHGDPSAADPAGRPSPPGRLRLGHRRLPRQRGPVPADRAAAPSRRGGTVRVLGERPWRLRSGGDGGRRGRPAGVVLQRPVPGLCGGPATGPAGRRAGARGRFLVAWSGMRGAVSLTVALALPLTTAAGGPFPGRDLIVFLTFVVILATLVGQGLSLPALIRRLQISDGGADADEELHARLVATKAALGQIDALADEDWTRDETVERIRAWYEYRKRRLAARAGKIQDEGYEDRSLAYQEM